MKTFIPQKLDEILELNWNLKQKTAEKPVADPINATIAVDNRLKDEHVILVKISFWRIFFI